MTEGSKAFFDEAKSGRWWWDKSNQQIREVFGYFGIQDRRHTTAHEAVCIIRRTKYLEIGDPRG